MIIIVLPTLCFLQNQNEVSDLKYWLLDGTRVINGKTNLSVKWVNVNKAPKLSFQYLLLFLVVKILAGSMRGILTRLVFLSYSCPAVLHNCILIAMIDISLPGVDVSSLFAYSFSLGHPF